MFLDDTRIADYDMRTIEIDQVHFGIPDTEYDATFTMSSSDFSRILKDLSRLSKTVEIQVDQDSPGVAFVCADDVEETRLCGVIIVPMVMDCDKGQKDKVDWGKKRNRKDESDTDGSQNCERDVEMVDGEDGEDMASESEGTESGDSSTVCML